MKSADIHLKPGLNVLVGRNNVGKSSALHAPRWALDQSSGDHSIWRRFQSASAVCAVGLTFASERDLAQFFTGEDRFIVNRPGSQDTLRLSGIHGLPELCSLEVGWLVTEPRNTHADRSWRLYGHPPDRTIYYDVTDGTIHTPEKRILESFPLQKGKISYLADQAQPRLSNLVRSWSTNPSGRVSYPAPATISSDESEEVQQALMFLKMRHDAEGFQPLARAFQAEFPEIRLDFDYIGPPNMYRPVFSSSSGGRALSVKRDAIGAGAWTFLALLTAARTAHVLGTSMLLLDEPHLYMHPALERAAIAHLLDPELWDGRPLDLLAATHSPEFVNAALARQGTVHLVRWTDQAAGRAEVVSIDNELHTLGGLASDLLYSSSRPVFVEGPSDAAALERLAPGLAHRNTYIPLRHADSLQTEDYLQALKFFTSRLSHQDPRGRKPVLVLDRDKQLTLERKWDRWGENHPGRYMRVVFVGLKNSDIESCLCDLALLATFAAKVLGEPCDEQRREELRALVAGVTAGRMKGDDVIEEICRWNADYSGKVTTLPDLFDLYRAAPAQYPSVEKELAELMEALSA